MKQQKPSTALTLNYHLNNQKPIKMLKIKIHPTQPKYVNGKGNIVFRYLVEGTEAELADYKAVKGEAFYREDKVLKQPLFFTSRAGGDVEELRKTSDGKDFTIDDTEAARFQSLVAQHGIEWACITMNKPLPQREMVKVSAPVVEAKKETEEKK